MHLIELSAMAPSVAPPMETTDQIANPKEAGVIMNSSHRNDIDHLSSNLEENPARLGSHHGQSIRQQAAITESYAAEKGPAQLTVLSWNIHDSMTRFEGPKSEDPDFIEFITQSSIFCLQETKQEFFVPNYEWFNNNRSGSRSGGVFMGIHRSIAGHVTVVKTFKLSRSLLMTIIVNSP